MAAPTPPSGWGRARPVDSDRDGRPTGLDGRLDLDRLDDDASLDLDVVGGDDAPLLSERVRARLEASGVLPWVRRHRVVTGALAVAAVVALMAGGAWWSSRPAPMAAPLVTVTTGGNEPARVITDPETGRATAITQLVLVHSSEPRDTMVSTLGVTGPGLVDPQSRVITAAPGNTVTGAVTSAIECSSDDSTSAVLEARASDYRVTISREAVGGVTSEDSVPLLGAEEWLGDVRRACVQIAADRDLSVAKVEVTPVASTIAADVRMLVRNSSDRDWPALRVSQGASPTVVSTGPDVDVPRHGEAWVPVRLWPDDCSHPVAPLVGGVPLRATLTEGDSSLEGRAPAFALPLDRTALDAVGRALEATCTATPPVARVVRAQVADGAASGVGASAGALALTVEVTAPGAFIVEIDDRPPDANGRVSALESPVHVVDDVARLRLRWELPQCFDLLSAGGPTVQVRLVDGSVRRPYLLALRGPALVKEVTTLCGRTVASVVR